MQWQLPRLDRASSLRLWGRLHRAFDAIFENFHTSNCDLILLKRCSVVFTTLGLVICDIDKKDAAALFHRCRNHY